MQARVGAFGAKGAFKRADPCIRCSRRQIAVAAFAIGAKLEHGDYLVSVSMAGQASIHGTEACKAIGKDQFGARGVQSPCCELNKVLLPIWQDLRQAAPKCPQG